MAQCAEILLSRSFNSYRLPARTRNFPVLAVSSKMYSSRGHNHGQRFLRPHSSRKRAGQARLPHGALRQIRPRSARPRPPALEGRTRQACLRKRFERSLEALDRAFQNGDERISPQPPRSQLTKNHGRTNGAILLRRRRQAPRRLRSPQSQRLKLGRGAALLRPISAKPIPVAAQHAAPALLSMPLRTQRLCVIFCFCPSSLFFTPPPAR